MRLGNVDDQKFSAVFVLIVELIEGRNLPPEGRSSVASKNQHNRPSLRRQCRQLNVCALIQCREREVRRGIALLQFAGAGVSP
jgi:hypothetical protein